MWLKCRLPGWTGSAWVWLAWLGWLPCCQACRVDWLGLGLARLDRLFSSLAGLLGGSAAVLGAAVHLRVRPACNPTPALAVVVDLEPLVVDSGCQSFLPRLRGRLAKERFLRAGGVRSHFAKPQFPCSLSFPFCKFGRTILVCITTPSALKARALLGEQAGGGWQALQASQAQARGAHPAGQAAGQPAKPGEPDPGRASPARESIF